MKETKQDKCVCVCVVARKGKTNEQGQPVNPTFLSRPGRICARRAGLMCAHKKEGNEMTGREGGQDVRRKRTESVCVGK